MYDNNHIYIIDFEDSFTYNIASELYPFDQNIQIIKHKEFFERKFFNTFISKVEVNKAIILGPGPGSPYDYELYFSQIRILKNHKHLFMMGICLGHQIIAIIDGFVIDSSKKPKHGNQEIINFSQKNILVQRYNSLAVYSPSDLENEIMVRKFVRGISYQFHPESVGTHRKSIFFKDLLNFIHNVR